MSITNNIKYAKIGRENMRKEGKGWIGMLKQAEWR